MISKTESGRVGYRKKYRVAGRVRVPAGHCLGVDGGQSKLIATLAVIPKNEKDKHGRMSKKRGRIEARAPAQKDASLSVE